MVSYRHDKQHVNQSSAPDMTIFYNTTLFTTLRQTQATNAELLSLLNFNFNFFFSIIFSFAVVSMDLITANNTQEKW